MWLSSRHSKPTSTASASSPYDPKWLPGRYSSDYLVAIKHDAASGSTSMQVPDSTESRRALNWSGHCALFRNNFTTVVPYIRPNTRVHNESVSGVAVPVSHMLAPTKDHIIDTTSGDLLVAMDCVRTEDQSGASELGPGWVIMKASTFGRFSLDQSWDDGSVGLQGLSVVAQSGEREDSWTVKPKSRTSAFQRAIATFKRRS